MQTMWESHKNSDLEKGVFITFDYANTLLEEMGVNQNVKKITFIGYHNVGFD